MFQIEWYIMSPWCYTRIITSYLKWNKTISTLNHRIVYNNQIPLPFWFNNRLILILWYIIKMYYSLFQQSKYKTRSYLNRKPWSCPFKSIKWSIHTTSSSSNIKYQNPSILLFINLAINPNNPTKPLQSNYQLLYILLLWSNDFLSSTIYSLFQLMKFP